jgi:hypothetical protein
MSDVEEVIVNCVLLRSERAVACGAFSFVTWHIEFEIYLLILNLKHMFSV